MVQLGTSIRLVGKQPTLVTRAAMGIICLDSSRMMHNNLGLSPCILILP